jgi:hypothetical protein
MTAVVRLDRIALSTALGRLRASFLATYGPISAMRQRAARASDGPRIAAGRLAK